MRSILKRFRRTVMLLAAGAAGAYFFDPEQGAARREQIMDRVQGVTGDSSFGGSGMTTGSSNATTPPASSGDELAGDLLDRGAGSTN